MRVRGWFSVFACVILFCAGGFHYACAAVPLAETLAASPALGSFPAYSGSTPAASPTPTRAPADRETFDLMFYVAIGCAVLGVLLLIIAIAMPKRRTVKRAKR